MAATVSWSSGVLATLTWWRSLVRIQPGLIAVSHQLTAVRNPMAESCRLIADGFLLPWPRGDGASFTRRRSQVRVLPGVLSRSDALNAHALAGSCGVDWSGTSTVS